MRRGILAVLLFVVWAGCGPSPADLYYRDLQTRMNGCLGVCTLDDFLADYGPPAGRSSGDKTITCTWVSRGPSGPALVPGGKIRGGEELRCVFNKESRLLEAWNYKSW